MACRILIPQPGTEPTPLAVKVQSPNHWATKEFSWLSILNIAVRTCQFQTPNLSLPASFTDF